MCARHNNKFMLVERAEKEVDVDDVAAETKSAMIM
jgi:hypothetical protein